MPALPRSRSRLRRALTALTAAAASGPLLSGCLVGPNYVRPAPLPVQGSTAGASPAAFKEAQGWKPAQPLDAVPKGDWWRVFGDPVLDGLERKVVITNQNVAAAEASYRQARAIVAQARSSLFPTLSTSLSVSRTGTLASSGGTIATTGAGGTIVTNGAGGGAVTNWNGSLDGAWAPDLWGRIRRTIEADRADAQASAADLANATLAAQADLASDYMQLRFYDEEKRVLQQTVQDYQRTLNVVQNQYGVGTVARADVVTAQTQVLAAQASLVDTDRLRAALEHAIAVLAGEPPSAVTLASGSLPATSPTPPAGLPSELLQRRPDVASAERLVAAANATIGVAVSAYFPDLTLSGSIGSSATDFGRLFRAENAVWSVGSALGETLIDFGARRAQVRQARAAYDRAVATYRQTVLTALQGVEDQLSAIRVLEQEQSVRDQEVDAARTAERLALNQYRAGQVDITTVITAQTNALAAQTNALSTRSDRLVSAVSLIAALGGGWTTADLPAD